MNSSDYLAALLNRFQRHTQCTEAYCLRREKATGDLKCRFYFPRELEEEATVTDKYNPRQWIFAPSRNDPILNQYCPAVTLGWLANTDMSPSTSLAGALQYAAKYCSKAEKETTSYRQLIQSVIRNVANPRSPLLSVASRMLMKLVGERDWSAQEVCHLLLGLPLVLATRKVIQLDCRPEDQQKHQLQIDEDGVNLRTSLLHKYKHRDEEYEDATFFDFLRLRDYSTWKIRHRAKPRIINYWPRYSSDPASDEYEHYCRVKMMLHHPFRAIDNLLAGPEGQLFESFEMAYSFCQQHHLGEHEEDFLEEVKSPDTTEDFESGPSVDEGLVQSGWELLAAGYPGHEHLREGPDGLADRDLDRAYDWSAHAGRYEDIDTDWWQATIAGFSDSRPINRSLGSLDSLQPRQRQIYDAVIGHYKKVLRGEEVAPLRFNIDGPAGTGKSYVIDLISDHLNVLADRAGRRNPVVRSAPTAGM